MPRPRRPSVGEMTPIDPRAEERTLLRALLTEVRALRADLARVAATPAPFTRPYRPETFRAHVYGDAATED